MIAQKRLDKIAQSKKIPHLLLFSGEKKIIAEAACRFVSKLLGEEKNHPDRHELVVEGKTGMHSLASIKMMLSTSALYPARGEYQFFILHDAERLLASSSHALLKTLEEPTSSSVFILLTCKPKLILPTIISRSQQFFFPMKEETILKSSAIEKILDWLSSEVTLAEISAFAKEIEQKKKEREKALLADLPSSCGPQEKELYVKEIDGSLSLFSKEQFESFLQTILSWYRDLFFLKNEISSSLIFPERKEALSRSLEKSRSIKEVEGILSCAKMAFDRMVSLESCLELIFLRLNLVK